MSLHPAFAAYLAELNPQIEAARQAGVQATPASARAALAGLNRYAAAPVPVAQVRDDAVTHDGVRVPVRLYVPRPDEPCDAVLFVHGGGHMAGDLDVYDHQARRTAAASGMVVVSVDYRRAPEAPYPAGLEDAYATLHALGEVLHGVRTTGVVHAVADSGGAAKVASIAQRVAAGQWTSPVRRQVLLYPSLDYTLAGASVTELGTGHFLEADRVRWYFEHYFADDDDRAAASPVLGPFTAAMPATLVVAAQYDPLLSEAQQYVERVQAAGSSARLVVVPGMIHAFAFFETVVPDEVEALWSLVGRFLRTGEV